MIQLEDVTPDTHERVVKVTDPERGLKGFIAVHNPAVGNAEGGLGISLGGIRMWDYASEAEAKQDAENLSEGMTQKSAMARDGCGGGKSTIMADPKKYPPGNPQRIALMQAMGEAIAEFNRQHPDSRYVGAEDMNTNPDDMGIIHSVVPDGVAGLQYGDFDGNPSPYTAKGVLVSMKEAMGVESMAGKKVAISGVGSVGGALARLLHEEGAQLVLADMEDKDTPDIPAKKAEDLKRELGEGVTTALSTEIHKRDVDVYAPCARGGCLNERTIPEIKADYVVGAANNQLGDIDKVTTRGTMLKEHGITYVPDFVANFAGVYIIADEIRKRSQGQELTEAGMQADIERIGRDNTRAVLDYANEHNLPTNVAARRIVEGIIANAGQEQGTGEPANDPGSPDWTQRTPRSDMGRAGAGEGRSLGG